MSVSNDLIARLLERTQPILQAIVAAGGHPLIVGGAVRDALLGISNSDIDIEVYQLNPAQLMRALEPLGKVNAVGRSFGVVKLRTPDRSEFDLALPQRRSFNATGQRAVILEPDPTMTLREAAARRDFTWNALGIHPDGTLVDFFGGVADLQAGVIRHVSPSFGEDPLRVLRAMQFAARFDMRLAPETASVCQALLPQAETIAVERVWGEWSKWSLALYPRAGLQALAESGWLALYPELVALRGCVQSPRYHPEGDVWTHTGYVCGAAAKIATREQLDNEQRRMLVFAALCHDLGKPNTTQIDANGRIRSYGHDQAGAEPARAFLNKIGALQSVVTHIVPLVREHMSHYNDVSARAVRRLAARLVPASIELWALLVEADFGGRPPLPPRAPAEPFIALARELAIDRQPPPPLLSGRDLIAAGYQAGPTLGPLLKQAYDAQIEGAFASTAEGLTWLSQNSKIQT